MSLGFPGFDFPGVALLLPCVRFILLFFLLHSQHSHSRNLTASATHSIFPSSRCSTPRPRTGPSRSTLTLSSFPPVGGVPIFPGSGNSSVTNHEVVSVRRPIGAEPAFPARGMLVHFPHAFAGGHFSPSLRPTIRLFPPGGGQVALLYFPLHT
jgi:hypothetical protein